MKHKMKFDSDHFALGIVLIYAFFGITWILTSDLLVNAIFTDQQLISKISIGKGWIYVMITSLLIYVLLHRLLKRIHHEEQMQKDQYSQLEMANRKLGESRKEVEDQYKTLMEYKEQLYHLAYRDQLTSLPNRLQFYNHIAQKIGQVSKSEKMALMILDLDHFKYVNDIFGHEYGDKILVQIADSLSELMNGHFTLYRLGGDEFGVIAEKTTQEEIVAFSEMILDHFQNLNFPDDMQLTMSIGIAISPDFALDHHDIIKYADVALFEAKDCGRNNYKFFEVDLKQQVDQKVLYQNLLKEAVKRNELVLHYQPQINLKTGEIRGFEALIRWNNPKLGFVPPMKFIPLAEETKQIIEIGEWVLKESLIFGNYLHERLGKYVRISVNVSPVQWIHGDVVDTIDRMLKAYHYPPGFLEIELTESILIQTFDMVIPKLKRLKHMGVSIALDDFGTGYSSLNYLKKLPISTLKIDKSFIDGLFDEKNNQTILNTIIELGHSMTLEVIAEGVEVKKQLNFMAENRCDCVQGFIFSKPIPQDDVEAYIIKRNTGNLLE